jgi:hypothetical protein
VTENAHLTPHVRASTRPVGLHVTGSFREAMMGGRAFILLKTGRKGRKSRNQAEIRLANLLKILGIGRFRNPIPSPRMEKTCNDWI